jgi:hypothetical protein
MAQMVITDMVELKTALKAVMIELNEETAVANANAANNDKLYSINEVRKRLGKAHATIKKLVDKGFIRVTKDGQISEASLNEYLQKA